MKVETGPGVSVGVGVGVSVGVFVGVGVREGNVGMMVGVFAGRRVFVAVTLAAVPSTATVQVASTVAGVAVAVRNGVSVGTAAAETCVGTSNTTATVGSGELVGRRPAGTNSGLRYTAIIPATPTTPSINIIAANTLTSRSPRLERRRP